MLHTQKAFYTNLEEQRRVARLEELDLRRKRSAEAKQRRQELLILIEELTDKINGFVLEENCSIALPTAELKCKDIGSIEYYTELYELEAQLREAIDATNSAWRKLHGRRSEKAIQAKKDLEELEEQLKARLDKLELEIDTTHRCFWEANKLLLSKEASSYDEALEKLGRHFWRAGWLESSKPRYEILIEKASAYPDLWWSIWSLLLANNNCLKAEDLTYEQFKNIFSILLRTGIGGVVSVKPTISILTWLLSDLQDKPKFTSRLVFNAVRQDYMITPRVSLSKLMSCKALGNMTKEQVIELFGYTKKKNNTKPSNEPVWYREVSYLPCTLNKRIFVKSIKPRRAKSRYEIYYSADEDNVYLTADYNFTYGSPNTTSHWNTVALSKTSKNLEFLMSHIETTLDLTPEAIVIERKTVEYKDFADKPFSINYINITK